MNSVSPLVDSTLVDSDFFLGALQKRVLLVVRVLLPFTDLPHCLWHPQPLIFEIDPLLTDAECDHIITKAVSGQQLWFSRCHSCWGFFCLSVTSSQRP